MGYDEWQSLYTLEDVETCFKNFVQILSYNEIYTVENLTKITALSSGLHIGACNWKITVGTWNVGILCSSSLEGEIRHPSVF